MTLIAPCVFPSIICLPSPPWGSTWAGLPVAVDLEQSSHLRAIILSPAAFKPGSHGRIVPSATGGSRSQSLCVRAIVSNVVSPSRDYCCVALSLPHHLLKTPATCNKTARGCSSSFGHWVAFGRERNTMVLKGGSKGGDVNKTLYPLDVVKKKHLFPNTWLYPEACQYPVKPDMLRCAEVRGCRAGGGWRFMD